MKLASALLGLVLLLDTTLAAEESCVGRCGSFEPQKKCQCDSMCVYYGSCCNDFDTVCPKKIARGDTFDEVPDVSTTPPTIKPSLNTITPTQPSSIRDTDPALTPTSAPPSPTGRPAGDPNAVACSGRPFDAFLQLKNGSIYAFRGEYFFELDDKSVLPGYPKLIQDVWGIAGPIDAAFTRINCQGKSYIFKGNQYWRFDGDVLDEDYPRDISVGFDGIPDDINAAFAIPAPSHRGKEKAYFFKGDKYHKYEFKHQPSHEECVQMTRASPSVLFSRYTDLFCDQTWEDIFADLFGEPFSGLDAGPRSISRDWHGISPPVDAAMVGRVFLSPASPSPPPAPRRPSRRRRPKKRGQRRRQSRQTMLDELLGYDDWFDFGDYFDDLGEVISTPEHKSTPVQNVYFFKKDKYYRVDLRRKMVDITIPSYPRSIAKYWLGCEREQTPDPSRAEKR